MGVAAINYWILLGFPAGLAISCLLAMGAWAWHRRQRAPFDELVRGAERHLHRHNVEQGLEQDSWPF